MNLYYKYVLIIYSLMLCSCNDQTKQDEHDLVKYEEINDIMPLWGKFKEGELDNDLSVMDCLFVYSNSPDYITNSMINKGWKRKVKKSQDFFQKNNYNICLFFDEKNKTLNVIIYYKTPNND